MEEVYKNKIEAQNRVIDELSKMILRLSEKNRKRVGVNAKESKESNYNK